MTNIHLHLVYCFFHSSRSNHTFRYPPEITSVWVNWCGIWAKSVVERCKLIYVISFGGLFYDLLPYTCTPWENECLIGVITLLLLELNFIVKYYDSKRTAYSYHVLRSKIIASKIMSVNFSCGKITRQCRTILHHNFN